MNLLSKYYLDTVIYNLLLSAVVAAYAGILWACFIFGTIGTVVGFIGYAYFKQNEYYLYHNGGYTKRMLMTRVWSINLVVMAINIGLYALIINLF